MEGEKKRKNIVLLHGWGASTKKLSKMAHSLRGMEWDVFVPKIPGFDAKPPKNAWQLNDFADFVGRKADGYFKKQSYIVFGHSFGGRVAIQMSNVKRVSALVLCASGGISRGNVVKRSIFYLLSKAGKVLLVIPSVANFWRRLLYKLAREHDYEKAKGAMKETFKNVISRDLKTQVKGIKKNTLVLWGVKDNLTSIKDAYYLEENIKNSTLVVFPDDGHSLPYEKYDEVAGEIDKWFKKL
jgi:pimeloyl-ACP methyl ester carboxylesterase